MGCNGKFILVLSLLKFIYNSLYDMDTAQIETLSHVSFPIIKEERYEK